MSEKWKQVLGYEGRYEVSSHGRVRSLPGRQKGRVLKPGKQSRGYLSVCLYDGSSPKRPKSKLVHVLVMEAHGPKRPSLDHEVNHKDLDRTNNNIQNLEWVTSQENTDHAKENGRHWYGERNGRCRVSEADMNEIHRQLAENPKDRHLSARLAKEYGLTATYVRQIRAGKYRKKENV